MRQIPRELDLEARIGLRAHGAHNNIHQQNPTSMESVCTASAQGQSMLGEQVRVTSAW